MQNVEHRESTYVRGLADVYEAQPYRESSAINAQAAIKRRAGINTAARESGELSYGESARVESSRSERNGDT